jgi:hypothetical protein
MIPIRPIGRFFENDSRGFVINPCSHDLIPSKYLPALDIIISSYEQELGNKLHSIYLRGSLPRGLVVDNLSDIDCFALIHEKNVRWKCASWQRKLNTKIRNQFNFVGNIETMLTSYEESFFKFNPTMSVVLKTQSLCIQGTDIIPNLPDFKPDKKMMLNYRWVEEDLKTFLDKENVQNRDCKKIMKIFLRTGFELVLERKGQYTPDLYLCYETFSQYYPQKQEQMKKALTLFLNPISEVSSLKEFTRKFGVWIIEEVDKQIR